MFNSQECKYKTVRNTILLLLFFTSMHSNIQAEMFKCTKSDGAVVFSDRPCKGIKKELIKQPKTSVSNNTINRDVIYLQELNSSEIQKMLNTYIKVNWVLSDCRILSDSKRDKYDDNSNHVYRHAISDLMKRKPKYSNSEINKEMRKIRNELRDGIRDEIQRKGCGSWEIKKYVKLYHRLKEQEIKKKRINKSQVIEEEFQKLSRIIAIKELCLEHDVSYKSRYEDSWNRWVSKRKKKVAKARTYKEYSNTMMKYRDKLLFKNNKGMFYGVQCKYVDKELDMDKNIILNTSSRSKVINAVKNSSKGGRDLSTSIEDNYPRLANIIAIKELCLEHDVFYKSRYEDSWNGWVSKRKEKVAKARTYKEYSETKNELREALNKTEDSSSFYSFYCYQTDRALNMDKKINPRTRFSRPEDTWGHFLKSLKNGNKNEALSCVLPDSDLSRIIKEMSTDAMNELGNKFITFKVDYASEKILEAIITTKDNKGFPVHMYNTNGEWKISEL